MHPISMLIRGPFRLFRGSSLSVLPAAMFLATIFLVSSAASVLADEPAKGAGSPSKPLRLWNEARTNDDRRAEAVDAAISLGKPGIEKLLPVVQADTNKAVETYVKAFTGRVMQGKVESIEEVLTATPKLKSLREAAARLGAYVSQLAEAAGMTPGDIDSYLRTQEEAVFRQLKLGPIWSKLDDAEIAAIEETNRQRAMQNLPPLEVDLNLTLTARDHSKDMATHGFFAHESPLPGKTTFRDRAARFSVEAAGENIFVGSTEGKDAVEAWMNSDGHRANILGSHSRIGVALARSADGTVYWCQQFR